MINSDSKELFAPTSLHAQRLYSFLYILFCAWGSKEQFSKLGLEQDHDEISLL